jgi:hypothetical protein
MSRLQLALDQILFARNYTERLLDDVPTNQWFHVSPGGVTHIAWQVGHLALAEYRLALERQRGRTAEDHALISDAFLASFGRDSVPEPDPGRNPPLDEILAVFRRVHAQVLVEAQSIPDAELDQPPLQPHRLATTRYACLLWCGHHEMLHAGQIGLLRRQMGQPPIW